MSQVSENDIHEIVVRVVRQTLGASASAGGALSGRLTDKPTTPLPFAEKPETQPSIEKRVVAIGTDHGGVELKKVLIQEISHMGFKIWIAARTRATLWITRILPWQWRSRLRKAQPGVAW